MTVIYNSNCYGRGLLRRLCNFAFTAPFIPVYYYGIHCNAFKLCEYFSILLLTVLRLFSVIWSGARLQLKKTAALFHLVLLVSKNTDL